MLQCAIHLEKKANWLKKMFLGSHTLYRPDAGNSLLVTINVNKGQKANNLDEIDIWDSVQLNHPYGTFSKFPEQAKER